jgi:2-hydroxychromene-2-carboxylate isomerase
MAAAIDFYFDFISPYGYLASAKIEALALRQGRTVNWRPFLMGVPIIKIMGLKPLLETPLKSDYTRHDIFRLAEWFDVPLVLPHAAATNSRAAARAFYWIHDQSPAAAVKFAKAAFQRTWVTAEDITDPAVLLQVTSSLGFAAEAVEQVLRSEAIKTRLEREVAAAVGRGVFGSPFFLVDGEAFWGVDRLPMLESWLAVGAWTPPVDRNPKETNDA